MRSWRDDIKKVLLYAGLENKPISFLFCDTQIIKEQMMEDINNILNSGDVTGIYQEKVIKLIFLKSKTQKVLCSNSKNFLFITGLRRYNGSMQSRMHQETTSCYENEYLHNLFKSS